MDKETYWKNRKDGKRGQGDKFNPVVSVRTPDNGMQFVSTKKVGKYALRKNSKRARKVNNG